MKEADELDLYNDITKISLTSIQMKVELSTELLKSRLEAMNAKSPLD
jgi:membrane-bound lytic murein transglycosylase D